MTDDDENPKITLGRRTFSVPEFAIKQSKRIIPRLQACGEFDFSRLTEENFDKLISIVHLAISRPGCLPNDEMLTLDELEDMPITIDQMTAAISLIAKRAGMGASKEGEPAGDQNPPIGTA